MDLKQTLDSELAPFTQGLITAAITDAGNFRFNKRHPHHLAVICLYCTLIELARSEMTLLENGDVTAMPVVLRSIFESHADFLAVLKDDEYYKSMYATLIEERIRFLRNVDRSSTNPFLAPVAAQLNVKSEIAKLQQELQDYKNKGRGPLTTGARFRAAKLGHEYESMYWLLCLESHNNISALEDRHIEKTGDDFEVLMFKDAQPDDLVRILDSLAATVIDCSVRLHQFLNTGVDAKYCSFKERLNDIRGNYPHGADPSLVRGVSGILCKRVFV